MPDRQLTSAKMRTILANERTFLAYIRTALGLIMAGLVLIRYFTGTVDLYLRLGVFFVVVGIAVIIGIVKTQQSAKKIHEIHHDEPV